MEQQEYIEGSFDPLSNSTWCTNLTVHPEKVFCVIIQSYKIHPTKVRVYDIVIIFLNLLFILFLLAKVVPTCKKLRLTWPLFTILYCLIFLIPVVSIVRGIFAMIFGHELPSKITHYLLRGTILVTEISVVVFGLFIKFFQRNSRFKLTVTMVAIIAVSTIFFVTQLLLDIFNVYEPLVCQSHHLFTHGGVIFQFSSSVIFAFAYMFIFCLFLFGIYKRWNLPTKKSFYRYALFLSIVNIVKATGSILWFFGTKQEVIGHIGVCFTMITSVIYLVTFAPVVYWIFLSNYFRMTHVPSTNDGIDSTSSSITRWFRWSLKPTKTINVPIYINNNETSRLIDQNSPQSPESSYSSIDSNELLSSS